MDSCQIAMKRLEEHLSRGDPVDAWRKELAGRRERPVACNMAQVQEQLACNIAQVPQQFACNFAQVP